MGLFFPGRTILEDTVLRHLLGKEEFAIAIWEKAKLPTYDAEILEGRVWIWTNWGTGKTIITGDEGNGWCIELATGINRHDAMKKYLRWKERNWDRAGSKGGGRVETGLGRVWKEIFKPSCYGDTVHCPVLFTSEMYACPYYKRCESNTLVHFKHISVFRRLGVHWRIRVKHTNRRK